MLIPMDRKTSAGITIFIAISVFHSVDRSTTDTLFGWIPKPLAAKEYSSGGPAFGFQFQPFGKFLCVGSWWKNSSAHSVVISRNSSIVW